MYNTYMCMHIYIWYNNNTIYSLNYELKNEYQLQISQFGSNYKNLTKNINATRSENISTVLYNNNHNYMSYRNQKVSTTGCPKRYGHISIGYN